MDVEDAADGPVLGGHLRLDATPRAAVARQDDLACHVDAHPVEFFVIPRDALVDVDEFGGDVAVG